MTCTPRAVGFLGEFHTYNTGVGLYGKDDAVFLTDSIMVFNAPRPLGAYYGSSGLFTVNRNGYWPMVEAGSYGEESTLASENYFPTGGFVDRGCSGGEAPGSADVSVVNVRVHAVQNDW